MYTPKIKEDLIPILYKKAKEEKKPMTRLVDDILRHSLIKDEVLINEASRLKSETITSPEILWSILKAKITDFFKEHFIVCCLDIRNRLISADIISIGTLTSSLVHPREVFETAIKRHSAQIIIAHNHPSGEPEPSEDDIKITKRLLDVSKCIGIEVIDHLIITETSFISFKHKGLI